MIKYIGIAFILGFWLVFPIPLMLLGVGGYTNIDATALAQVGGNPVQQLSQAWSILSMYFQILFINIPDVNIFVNVFVLFLKLMSGVSIVLLVKGE